MGSGAVIMRSMQPSTRRAARENGRPHVIVIGGGISGLAAAERLARIPRPPHITLLEAASSLGGCIGTDRVNGFVIERGPDVFLAGTPAVRDLCERVGIADRVIATRREAATAYLLRDGRLVRSAEPARPLYSGSAVAVGGARPELRSLRGGLGTLIEAVTEVIIRAGVEIRSGARVDSVELAREGPRHGGNRSRVALANGESLDADAIVIATPASRAAGLLASTDETLAADLCATQYASLSIVTLGYGPADTPSDLDATGYTVPPDEGRPVLACTWSSAKLEGRAPDGHSLFRIFFSGARFTAADRCDDPTLIAMARSELRDVLGIAGEPSIARVVRWMDAMPRYDAEHAARVARIDRHMAGMPGIALAGNAYGGVGIPDCVRSGSAAADRVVDFLAGRLP